MNYQYISRFSKKQEARKVFKIQGMTLLHDFAASPDWGKLSLQKYAYRISLALPRRDLKENRTCMSQTFKSGKWLLFWIFRRFNSSIPRLVYTILNNALCCFSCPLKRKIRSVYHKILVVRANPLHIGIRYKSLLQLHSCLKQTTLLVAAIAVAMLVGFIKFLTKHTNDLVIELYCYTDDRGKRK